MIEGGQQGVWTIAKPQFDCDTRLQRRATYDQAGLKLAIKTAMIRTDVEHYAWSWSTTGSPPARQPAERRVAGPMRKSPRPSVVVVYRSRARAPGDPPGAGPRPAQRCPWMWEPASGGTQQRRQGRSRNDDFGTLSEPNIEPPTGVLGPPIHVAQPCQKSAGSRTGSRLLPI